MSPPPPVESGSPPSRNVSENAEVSDESPIANTARWTCYLPEAFGIRKSIEASKYRWCARESALWGIATGTAMSLHRFRMRSSTTFAINMGFITCFTVFTGSYYFCVKRRDYQEQMIELMMKLNTFDHAANMPEELPYDENHPFLQPIDGTTDGVPQYVAHIPERKEWQPPLSSQDVMDTFQPYDPKPDGKK
jgi:Protein of unknown function (DUF3767)